MGEQGSQDEASRLPEWLRDRDWLLLLLLVCLNVGSAYTTVLGARQILPYPMSDVLGVAVQAMLFFMLAGFAVRQALVRKWVVISIFAAASIYTSFFAYYEQLARDADDQVRLDTALQTHAAFVSVIYQPARSRIESLDRQAEALFSLAEREAQRGSTSGVSGYGPVAKGYAEDASRKKLEAQGLLADVVRLEPHFEYAVAELSPDDIYQRDLEAWQLAPVVWKAAVPTPVRTDYVDLGAQVALLTPYRRVSSGELPALTALALASLVDGIAIFLGTAIQARRRSAVEVWSEEVAGTIGQVRRGWSLVRGSFLGESATGYQDALLDDALQVVDLRIAGRGSNFLITFYQAIHPETGVLDYSGLQRHPNPTYRIAARMLVDQLRAPTLQWITVDEGWWTVPEGVYPRVTAWLGDQIRRECTLEAEGTPVPAADLETERTLRLVIPA